MSTNENPNDPNYDPPFPGKFYVFLHGLIAVQCQPNTLDLLIPDVGPGHVYRFGEFLGEITLPPAAAPYHITGIVGGIGTFDPQQHLVTSQPTPVCGGSKLYARITLPQPACVHSYLKVDLKGVIEDPCGHLASDPFGTMVPVLEYSFYDPRKILFGCDPLNVAPIQDEHGDWYMNLHIFAEEDFERPEDHTLGGFQAIAALFNFASAPRLLSISNIPSPQKGTPIPGTTPLEFISLALRTRELGYLGRFVRYQMLHGHSPVIVRVSPLGGDPITCLPLISQ